MTNDEANAILDAARAGDDVSKAAIIRALVRTGDLPPFGATTEAPSIRKVRDVLTCGPSTIPNLVKATGTSRTTVEGAVRALRAQGDPLAANVRDARYAMDRQPKPKPRLVQPPLERVDIVSTALRSRSLVEQAWMRAA